MRDYARSVAEAEKANEQFNAKLSKSTTVAMKMLGSMPIAAAAAGAATGIALAGVPILFGAIAAAALSSNARVSSSFHEMTGNISDGVKSAAAPLEGTLVKAIDKVDSSFARMQPAIEVAMTSSAGSVLKLVDGVTALAENALPGLVIASQNSYAPMVGMQNLMAKAGTGASDFFRNLSSGAGSSGRILSELGDVVRDFLGFAGQLFANLSNNGVGVLSQLNAALNQVYQIILRVSSDGLPVATGAFSGFMTIVSGALSVITAVSGALGGWLGPLAQVAGALKAVDMITFGAVTRSFDGLGAKLKESPGFAAKAGTALGTTLATAISPAGLAITALAIGLTILGEKQQQAARHASEHKGRIQELTSAIQQDNGAVGNATQAIVAKALADQNAIGNAKALGLSLGQVTLAANGNKTALDGVTGSIDRQITSVLAASPENAYFTDTFKGLSQEMVNTGKGANELISNYSSWRAHSLDLNDAQRSQLDALLNLKATVLQQNQAVGQATTIQQAYQQALANSSTQLTASQYASQATSSATSRMAEAMKTLADFTTDAAAKGQALVTVLDMLNGRVPSYEEAQQTINDTLRQMGEEFGKNIDKAAGFGNQLVNLDGTVNTTTANGSSLQNQLVTLQGGFANSGAAIQDLVGKGMSLSAATNKVNGDLGAQQNQLIGVLQKAGLTKGQIDSLIRTYGLVPRDVTTNVVAHTGAAEAAINYAARDRVVTISTSFRDVGGAGFGNPTGRARAFADGGIIYNDVGRTLTPMGTQAAKVNPNTWRVIGDNMRVPESFIPWDGSARSLSLLAQTADAFGLGLSAGQGAPVVVSSAPSQGVTIVVNQYGTIVGSNGTREFAEILKQEIIRTDRRAGR
ncbi:hypothetical protein [Amycolatopsis sp. lyj-112]|uniref:hypothetical protein n=1 Tax=Amycolatopsis sp. lyj-112 TaxID=2789288 RepID=UPI00397DA7F4